MLAVFTVGSLVGVFAQSTAVPVGLEAYLKSEMQKRKIPGLQIAIVRGGRIVMQGAYGIANLENSVPVTRQTVFSINSATKSFTGVAIMQLVEAGKVDLDAPVSRYLDGLPTAWQTVKIRQLLSHTSGIPNIMDGSARAVMNLNRGSVCSPRCSRPSALRKRKSTALTNSAARARTWSQISTTR
jgi:CubicO group peptidase (beta-lactamase class C family)